jgi:guanylate kinase
LNSDSDPRIIVLTAPSGSGKTTIAHALMLALPELRFSVSATTRPPRPGEKEGVHYHFLSETEFEEARRDGRLIEYEEVYPGCWYGTLASEVERSSAADPVLLDIDVIGATNVKRIFGDHALVLFISPPSISILESRLRARRTESEEAFRVRLERTKMELTYEDRFDVKIVNDVLEDAVREGIRVVCQFLGRDLPGPRL